MYMSSDCWMAFRVLSIWFRKSSRPVVWHNKQFHVGDEVVTVSCYIRLTTRHGMASYCEYEHAEHMDVLTASFIRLIMMVRTRNPEWVLYDSCNHFFLIANFVV